MGQGTRYTARFFAEHQWQGPAGGQCDRGQSGQALTGVGRGTPRPQQTAVLSGLQKGLQAKSFSIILLSSSLQNSLTLTSQNFVVVT